MARKTPQLTIAAADCETDPFKVGRTDIKPFSWGIYDGTIYVEFWGDDATEKFLKYLKEYEGSLIIYAHNGGKFDWLFLFPHLSGDMQFIGSRLVKANLFHHEIRDSYANMPVPLKMFEDESIGKKFEFDYSKLERGKREKNKTEILAYQKQDILVLHAAILKWIDMFGRKSLTMASAAFKALKQTMADIDVKIETLNRDQDADLRPFYFGGRVCCFEKGNLSTKSTFKVYDVNSMYPYVMKEYKHPISAEAFTRNYIDENTDFALIDATSAGALPLRSENGGVDFPHGRFMFYATGHEIRAALELGLITIHKIEYALEYAHKVTFEEFVDKYYGLRLEAASGRLMMYVLFYKLVLNSAYGKFAINPDEFTENELLPRDLCPEGMDWAEKEFFPEFNLILWERPAARREHCFINVATAASITGGSRAVIMRGLAKAVRPVYCDTDSIICEEFNGECDPKKLGMWKYEGEGKNIAIAGKKLYALTNGSVPGKDGEVIKGVVKTASKGVDIPAKEIIRVAGGRTVTYTATAPIFKIDGRQIILSRRVKSTAKLEKSQ